MIDLLLRYYNFGFDSENTKLPTFIDDEIYDYFVLTGGKYLKTAKFFKCGETTVRTAIARTEKKRGITDGYYKPKRTTKPKDNIPIVSVQTRQRVPGRKSIAKVS